jgi:hypothetical protein
MLVNAMEFYGGWINDCITFKIITLGIDRINIF